MASLDFDFEKSTFREFYDLNHLLLEDAKNSFITLLHALVSHAGSIQISKVEGRVKDKEECVRKFNEKYRTDLELKSEDYSIRDHITDLIGLRIVCLYEDDIEQIKNIISEHFDIIDVTDKISQIENTESSFGYKGLHFDLRLKQNRKELPEYSTYSDFPFELQIRTIIQDSWSVLDHKIKYKKSIPNNLKRRINTLAALFELADREFREIRDATTQEIEKEESVEMDDDVSSNPQGTNSLEEQESSNIYHVKLNVFSFLKIAKHFFNHYEFDPHKVDGFTQEIIALEPKISRGKFNFYMRENISKVKQYERIDENNILTPYKIISYCLYLGNKAVFSSLLTNIEKEAFDAWNSN